MTKDAWDTVEALTLTWGNCPDVGQMKVGLFLESRITRKPSPLIPTLTLKDSTLVLSMGRVRQLVGMRSGLKWRSRRTIQQESRIRPQRRRRGLTVALLVLLTVIITAGIGRMILPSFLRDYVNRTLDRNPTYDGEIGSVELRLLRGAYAIHDVRINKTTGNVPVPFFAAKRVDFAVQWNALLEHKLVGRIVMERPEINFVDAGSEGEEQTGAGAPWLQIIKDLFPFRINSAVVRNGSIHFRAFQSKKPVDVYLSNVQATVDNLGNIRDETKPLVATVQATGLAMDQAKFEYKMTMNPFAYRPTFKMALRLMGLDVTKLNDLARTYGKFDFEHGWFDLVIEADAKEGLITGYAKPLFRNLDVFSLREDLKVDNALQAFWQALVGATAAIFKNQPRDQFGTLIPFQGDLSTATTTDLLATLGNVLRNAFVRAYLPRLEGGQESVEGLIFGPAELGDPISVGDSSSDNE